MEKNITFQYIRKKLFLFKVLGISVVFYTILNYYVCSFNGKMDVWLNQIKEPYNFLNLILFGNASPFIGVGHLWYLFALLYAYIGIYALKRITNKDRLKIAIFLSMVLYLIEVVDYYYGFTVPEYLYRNVFLKDDP